MTQSPSDGTEDQERTPHPENPAEGASSDQGEGTHVPRVHPEDPAEGADDESAVS